MTEQTDDEIVTLGCFSEALLMDHSFNRLVELFNQQCFMNFANTTVKQNDIREEAFIRYDGLRTFLGMMTEYAATAHKLTNPETAPSEYSDAL
jgi:hypothetical protein